MTTRRLLRLFSGIALVLYALIAGAHTQSVSYSVWYLGEETSVSFRISQLELNRLGLHPGQADYTSQVKALAAGWLEIDDACTPISLESLPTEAGWVQIKQVWKCPTANEPLASTDDQAFHPAFIRIAGIFDRINYHTNLAAIYLHSGQMVQTKFNAQTTQWSQHASASPSGFKSLFEFGLLHIVTGWDHLLFLLVLILSTNRITQVIGLATGFTLGHSITLAAQVLGLVKPSTMAVEWVIAFSILLVAVQNAWQAQRHAQSWPYALVPGLLILGWLGGALSLGLTMGLALFSLCHLRWQQGEAMVSTNINTQGGAINCIPNHSPITRQNLLSVPWVITLAFGLFHGFGFASLLGELQLPSHNLVMPLLAFNLGVEAGQIIMIAIALPIIRLLAKLWSNSHGWINAFAASAATFWLVTRTF